MTPILNFIPRKGTDNDGRRISNIQSGLWYIGSYSYFGTSDTLVVRFRPPSLTYEWFYYE
jgi:hypothetical protein